MNRFFQKFLLYAKLPEMRLFWFFLPFLAILAGINFVPMAGFWKIFISSAIFLVLAVIILINNLRLAASNLEIKIERNELRSIIFNLIDGVIAYDPNFKILIFNRAAEAIFNIRAAEATNQSFMPDKAQEGNLRLLSQVIFPSLAPLVVRRSDTGIYPQIIDLSFDEPAIELRVVTDKILDPAGQLLGFVKIVHDRTREVQLLRGKSEFISVAAHQLRTPLTGVQWALEALSQKPSAEKEKELIDGALVATAKLLETVNDLLDVSKIEEGRFGYQFENVEIISFVEEVVGEAQGLAQRANIKFYFQKPNEPSIPLSVDSQKLKMALFNVLDNAIRYNVSNGEVIVSILRIKDQPYVKISIKDTGIGIPAGEISKLFTKFFRAENVTKFSQEGSGLGLYIARNIVKRHGGEIWVESEVNRGSTFYITLPTDPKLIPTKEIAFDEE